MVKQLYKRHWTVLAGADEYYLFCEDVFGGYKGHINQTIGTLPRDVFNALPHAAKLACVSKSIELITTDADKAYRHTAPDVPCHPAFAQKRAAQ